ncbi:monovalent cation/H+ antiporter subunit E [Haladaptatus sp. F3-133]|uniref:Monovalent cation/H+ antiporter subunit E n=1 Tax=Halorutilus salinus TaxID=2487751 RepID=A0A9Q4GIY6_9EURY|nr:monovalent cation/H+ antiporter subunit E [Halorutilus salinus]
MPDSEKASAVLVPVSDTPTADETVRYAVDSADNNEIHFVFVVSKPRGRREGDAEEVLEKARVWADEVGTDASVRFEVLEPETYLFGPGDYAEIFAEYASENGIERVVLDPNYRVSATSPALQPLSDEIRSYDTLSVETAPIERPARRPSLLTRGGASRFTALFVLSYGFYLVLGSFLTFDLVTGGVTAAVVAVTLERVSFEASPTARRVPGLALRLAVFVPYLLREIVVANFRIAYVVLHPDLPIDPSVERFEAAVWGGAAVTTLANSITLTPGTLTVEANGRTLYVHALTQDARDGLREGALERAVRFVFYGRRALDYPKPKERQEREGDG